MVSYELKRTLEKSRETLRSLDLKEVRKEVGKYAEDNF